MKLPQQTLGQAHLNKAIARFLQRIHVLQGAQHYWQHHKWPHDCNYCTLTPWMNPILDRIGLWRGIERLLIPLLGPVRTEAPLK